MGVKKPFNHPDVCWQGLRNVSSFKIYYEHHAARKHIPLFLFGRLNNSHYTCTEKLYVHGKTKSIMGHPHPLATGQKFVYLEGLFQRQRSLSHDGKETIALICPNGQNSWNKWNCGPWNLAPFCSDNGAGSSWGRTVLSFWVDAKWMRRSWWVANRVCISVSLAGWLRCFTFV